MQERDLREIRARAAVLIRRLSPRHRVGVDPALGAEVVCGVAPELGAAVDGLRTNADDGSAGDLLPGDGGVADGLAAGHGHGGVQAQDLVHDAVEIGHAFELLPGDGGVGGGDRSADLGPERLLDVRVQGEVVAGPGEGVGGCFMLGGVSLEELRGGREYARRPREMSAFGRRARCR